MKPRSFILLILIVCTWVVYLKLRDHHTPPTITTTQQEVLYWYDPMRPDQHFDKPGKSPFMDMDLVPKYKNEVSDPAITPRFQQAHSVKIGKVSRDAQSLPTLPNEAIIATGKRYFVIRAEGSGYFLPQAVTVADMNTDPVVITQGITAGENVVLTPAFLVDAEANIDAFFERMQSAGDHHD